MKQMIVKTEVTVASLEELSAADRSLVEAARRATLRSYAPYSRFRVGAALRLADGTTLTGTNQENVAYPSGLCAERTALFYAGSEHPDVAVETMAIAAHDGRLLAVRPVTPCGACRQVMLESEVRQRRPIRLLLCGAEEVLVVDGVRQLLPLAFEELG